MPTFEISPEIMDLGIVYVVTNKNVKLFPRHNFNLLCVYRRWYPALHPIYMSKISKAMRLLLGNMGSTRCISPIIWKTYVDGEVCEWRLNGLGQGLGVSFFSFYNVF